VSGLEFGRVSMSLQKLGVRGGAWLHTTLLCQSSDAPYSSDLGKCHVQEHEAGSHRCGTEALASTSSSPTGGTVLGCPPQCASCKAGFRCS